MTFKKCFKDPGLFYGISHSLGGVVNKRIACYKNEADALNAMDGAGTWTRITEQQAEKFFNRYGIEIVLKEKVK